MTTPPSHSATPERCTHQRFPRPPSKLGKAISPREKGSKLCNYQRAVRVSELGREVTGRRAPRRGTLFGRSMVHSLDHLPRLMLVPLALFQVSLTPTTCFRGHKVSRWQKWSLKLPGLSRPLRKTVRSISLSRPFCISASRPKLECRDTR